MSHSIHIIVSNFGAKAVPSDLNIVFPLLGLGSREQKRLEEAASSSQIPEEVYFFLFELNCRT